jgi:ribonuclease-3
MPTPFSSLERRIDYHFGDPTLLQQALRHASLDLGVEDNQRLEFLGDAILGLTIAEALYRKFPHADEGKLDRMRAGIVSGPVLAAKAGELQLEQYLLVSDAQRMHHAKPSQSMLEDALEAVIGAIYLDGGLTAAQHTIAKLFGEQLSQDMHAASAGTPKSRLQEWTQKHNAGATPDYILRSVDGPDHARTYLVAVELSGQVLGEGRGSSLKAAEIAAAEAALQMLTAE